MIKDFSASSKKMLSTICTGEVHTLKSGQNKRELVDIVKITLGWS